MHGILPLLNQELLINVIFSGINGTLKTALRITKGIILVQWKIYILLAYKTLRTNYTVLVEYYNTSKVQYHPTLC